MFFALPGFFTPQIDSFSFGNALRFDGVNDYVSFTNPISKPAGDPGYAISLWVNFPATPSFEYLLGASSAASEWLRFNSTTSVTFRSRPSGVGTTTWTIPAISIDTWYHVAVSLVGGTNELWINGTKYTGDADNYDIENLSIDTIGEFGGAYGQFIMDELAIQTGSGLTQTDVDFLYNSGNGNSALEVMTPGVYYKLDESGTESTAVDSSGNSNDGTLNNFTLPGAWVAH